MPWQTGNNIKLILLLEKLETKGITRGLLPRKHAHIPSCLSVCQRQEGSTCQLIWFVRVSITSLLLFPDEYFWQVLDTFPLQLVLKASPYHSHCSPFTEHEHGGHGSHELTAVLCKNSRAQNPHHIINMCCVTISSCSWNQTHTGSHTGVMLSCLVGHM